MLLTVSSVCIRSRKGFVERLPVMGESRLGGESVGAELFGGAGGCSDLGFGAEL